MRIINLLPKPRQSELRYEAMLHSLWFVCVLSVLSYVLVFMVQFGVKFYLQFEAGSIKAQITQLQAEAQKQQTSDVKTQVTQVNNLISDYNNLAASSPKWSNLIKAFAPLPPDGVKINSLTIDPVGKSIAINGLSPTRELVIQLYNNILNDKTHFYGINYPLENVAKPTNVAFHFNFYFREDLIK